jgi:hypothetical protein
MKYWAKFYGLSTGYVEGSIPPRFDPANRTPIEACGDRAVLRLDGRLSGDNFHTIAVEWAKRHGFVGYSLQRGGAFSRPQYTSSFYPVGA